MKPLAYQQFGEGPPLLMLHGWPFHTASYRKLLPLLSKHFTCYLVESAGLSDQVSANDKDMTFMGHARRLVDIVEELGFAQVNMLGHDTGGTIARFAAVELGNKVRKLALLNTEMPNHRPPFIPLYQKLTHLPGTRQVLGALLKYDWYLYSAMGFGGCFHNAKHIDEEFRSLFVAHWFANSARYQGFIAYLQGLDFSALEQLDDVHAKITAPIKFIWGENDITFPVEPALQMAQRIPQGAEFVVIPNSAFLLQEEQPELVATELKTFFNSE